MAKPPGMTPAPTDDRLTESKLAHLESAWRGGEYETVRAYLEAYPREELVRTPMALWLLAWCRFDGGDVAGACAHALELCTCDWRPALVAGLRARLAAAQGDAAEAERRLQDARAAGLPSADAAALELVVATSLFRFERMAELLKSSSSLPPGQSRERRLLDNCRTLAANLLALNQRQPELVQPLVAARPWDAFRVLDQRGAATAHLRTGRGCEPLYPGPEQHAREADALARCAPRLRMTTPVLLVGLGTGNVVGELAKVPPLHGKRLGIVAVPMRFEELAGLLLMHDWSALLAEGTLHFLTAEEAALQRYLQEDLRRVPLGYEFTTCVIAPAPAGADYERKAARVLAGLRRDLDSRVRGTAEYYASTGFAERWRRQGRAGGLVIMIQSCRYTTFVHHNSLHLAEAFRAAGHQVVLLQEGEEPQQWIGPAYIAAQIERYRPDLYLRINFLRQETDATMPPGLPFLTWVQDYCPTHTEPGRAERLLPRDYLTGISKSVLLGHGFPAERYLPNVAPSLAALYRGAAARERNYRFDISYVSHHSTPPGEWVKRFGATRRAPAELRWVLGLAAELENAYRQGRLLHDVLAQLGAEFVESLVPSPWPGWVYGYALQLTNLYFRQTILAWIAEAGYELALFGNGWERHPTLGRFARGPVANGPELKECYRASRVHLQLMATGNLHQRLIDGYLAGAFFLMPRQADYSSLLAVRDPALHRRLLATLAERPLTTIAELKAAAAELARYLEELTPPGGDVRATFSQAESDLLSRTELRIPAAAEVMFGSREELLERIDYWLPRDRERESFVERLAGSGCLESFTAEFQVRRILSWLAERIAGQDPPVPLPALFGDVDRVVSAAGRFTDGRPSGVWRFHRAEGSLAVEGSYRAGVAEGVWTLYTSGGVRQASGTLRQNRKHGRWVVFDQVGERVEHYHEGLLHGPIEQRSSRGVVLVQGTHDNGLPIGPWRYFYPSGAPFACGEFRDGKKQGTWQQFHPNGVLAREAVYVAGRRQGTAVRFHPNGALWGSGPVVDDQPHGCHERYFADGRLRSRRNYCHGKPDGQWRFYHRNGQLKWTIAFQAGKPDGVWTSWYANGAPRATGTFNQGARRGTWRRWDRSGASIQQRAMEAADRMSTG